MLSQANHVRQYHTTADRSTRPFDGMSTTSQHVPSPTYSSTKTFVYEQARFQYPNQRIGTPAVRVYSATAFELLNRDWLPVGASTPVTLRWSHGPSERSADA